MIYVHCFHFTHILVVVVVVFLFLYHKTFFIKETSFDIYDMCPLFVVFHETPFLCVFPPQVILLLLLCSFY